MCWGCAWGTCWSCFSPPRRGAHHRNSKQPLRNPLWQGNKGSSYPRCYSQYVLTTNGLRFLKYAVNFHWLHYFFSLLRWRLNHYLHQDEWLRIRAFWSYSWTSFLIWRCCAMPMWGELSKPENSNSTVCQYRSVLAIYRKPKRYSLVGDHMKVNAEFDCLSPQNCVVLLWLTFYFLDAEQGIRLLLVKKIVVIWLLLLLGKWIDKQALLKICLYSINLHRPEYLVSNRSFNKQFS